MKNARKCIKGFDSNLKCRDFQYEIGKEYKLNENEHVSICQTGFHAIDEDENPLVVFSYYPPVIDGKSSRYCEVEIGGETEKKGEKICGSEIKIVKEIGIKGVVKAHEEWVKRHNIDNDENKSHQTGDCSVASNTGYGSVASNTGYGSSASNTGKYSLASNTGNCSSASNTGDCSVASNTGKYSLASNTGYGSAASNTGNCSVSSNTGNSSVAFNTGNYSVASNTGDRSMASNTGYCSMASNIGNDSMAEVSGNGSVAVATGYGNKVKGALGCAIVIAERGEWNGVTYPLIGGVFAIVDGVNVKADTWYTCKDGVLVEE